MLQRRERERRGTFISDDEFKRLAHQQPISWSNLSRDCIYKLEWINKADQHQIAENLTNYDGITISVLLPPFIVDKLLMITKSDVGIYVRPRGEDEVDIATPKKHICNNCNKELALRAFLQRHLKCCTTVM